MKTKKRIPFDSLPRDYAGLCRRLIPRPIHDRVNYDNTVEMAEAFAGFEKRMNRDQTDYFDLLCALIEDYEEAASPERTPLQMLEHLLAEHGLSAADLSRVLGSHRTLGPMILRGERSITAEHARTLGRHFGLPAGAFIE